MDRSLGRPRKSAAERRQQARRAEMRMVGKILAGVRDLQAHRGGQPSVLVEALARALGQGQGRQQQQQEDWWGRGETPKGERRAEERGEPRRAEGGPQAKRRRRQKEEREKEQREREQRESEQREEEQREKKQRENEQRETEQREKEQRKKEQLEGTTVPYEVAFEIVGDQVSIMVETAVSARQKARAAGFPDADVLSSPEYMRLNDIINELRDLRASLPHSGICAASLRSTVKNILAKRPT